MKTTRITAKYVANQEIGITADNQLNYATQAINLWIKNNAQSSEYWLSQALEADIEEMVQGGVVSASQILANFLKEWHTENNPLEQDNSVYADFIAVALEEINWQEIANSLLEEARSRAEGHYSDNQEEI